MRINATSGNSFLNFFAQSTLPLVCLFVFAFLIGYQQ